MSTEGVNEGRRRFLIGATSAVGAVGVVGAAVPFVKSWNPSAKAKTAGAPVVADISKLAVGQGWVRFIVLFRCISLVGAMRHDERSILSAPSAMGPVAEICLL